MPNTQRSDVVKLLEYYPICKRFVASQKYAAEYFDATVESEGDYRKIMSLIESLIKSIAPSDEATLLHLHYVKGLSVEKCAECMFVSRSTGFRLLKRAQDKVFEKYKEARYET